MKAFFYKNPDNNLSNGALENFDNNQKFQTTTSPTARSKILTTTHKNSRQQPLQRRARDFDGATQRFGSSGGLAQFERQQLLED
jgi:hypothetical protein